MPNNVSGLVVKHSIFSKFLLPSILNLILQPKDLPIQFLCINFTLSGHLLSLFKSSNNSSENLRILKNHCLSFFLSTIAPDRQPLPSITCSFANTVSSTGSQFTKLSFL